MNNRMSGRRKAIDPSRSENGSFLSRRYARALVLLASAALGTLCLGEAAWADCSPAAANNVTATCTGTTNNQGGGAPGTSADSFGYGTGTETGVTVTVGSNATVTGTDQAINIADGTIINGAGATITGAWGIRAATGSINLTNSGIVAGTSPGASYGINVFTDATVTNNAGASITSRGIAIRGSQGFVNVINSGSITGTGTQSSAIRAGTYATVTNNAGGSITGTLYGIYAAGGGSSVVNAGSISGVTAAILFAGTGNTLTLAPGSAISGNVLGTGSDTFQLGGTGAATFDVSQIDPAGQYRGFGTFNKIGSSTWTLTGTPGQSTSWSINGGTLSVSSNANLGAGTLVLSGANSFSGVNIEAGTLSLAGVGTLGAATGTTTVAGGTLDLGGTTQTQAAVQLNGGTLQNGALNAPISSAGGTLNGVGGTASVTTTAGTTIIAGTNGYTGATTVNGGTLQVDGTITGTSSVEVNAGGKLTGIGTIDPLTVTINNAGTFAPGNGTPGTTTAIVGNLAFQSGAFYMVQINPATSSQANVTGTAALGGSTVNAVFAAGSYVAKQYVILTAGSVSGTFGALVNTNKPASISDTLSYDATHAYLNASLNFSTPTSGLNGNQQAVANTLVNFFNSTGGIPFAFAALSAGGLAQASGESATGSQQATFNAMGQFMGLLTDPFIGGRGDGIGTGGTATGYAGSDTLGYAAKPNPDDALGAIYRKAPPMTPPLDRPWSVWSAGFGGSQITDGNATLGTNSATSRIYGGAVGLDYRLSPATIAGFALAGGGTNFSVANSGSGRSDLFSGRRLRAAHCWRGVPDRRAGLWLAGHHHRPHRHRRRR
jgi:autotransporter-associated beta strand protein